ncbi:hypothetical protein COOONC_05974 [Cooperia oncophora]
MNLSDMPQVTPRQLRIFMLMESPNHAKSVLYRIPHQSGAAIRDYIGGAVRFTEKEGAFQIPRNLRNFFNATMTYRRDSRYFHPYGQFVPLAPDDRTQPRLFVTQQQIVGSLKRKTRGSLIFVSNCRTPSERERLIKELGQYTEVTVRGKCEEEFSVGNDTRTFSCKENCDDDALIG